MALPTARQIVSLPAAHTTWPSSNHGIYKRIKYFFPNDSHSLRLRSTRKISGNSCSAKLISFHKTDDKSSMLPIQYQPTTSCLLVYDTSTSLFFDLPNSVSKFAITTLYSVFPSAGTVLGTRSLYKPRCKIFSLPFLFVRPPNTFVIKVLGFHARNSDKTAVQPWANHHSRPHLYFHINRDA